MAQSGQAGWAGGCRTAPESRPAVQRLMPAWSVRPASAGWWRPGHFRCAHSSAGSPTADRQTTPNGAGHATQNRPPTRLAATTDARTDQGPFPPPPTDGYRVLGYVAHFRAVAATCLSCAQANLGPSPTSPTDHHRASGPRRSPSGQGNNLPPRRSDKARACAKLTNKRFSGTLSSHSSALSIFDGPWLAAAMAILPALATLPATGEARTHFGPSPVWPADGLRAYGPHLSIVGGPQVTVARRCPCCHCRRSRRI